MCLCWCLGRECAKVLELQQPPTFLPADVHVTTRVARHLLATQYPELKNAELVILAEGWDNVILRAGPDHILRLPRRAIGATLLSRELRWLPTIAAHLPIPISLAIHHGISDAHFPYPWAIVPWFEGVTLGHLEQKVDADFAQSLGVFMGALHRINLPSDAPINPMRHNPFEDQERDVRVRQLIQDFCPQHHTRVQLMEIWARALNIGGEPPQCWCHGDLHPFNLIMKGCHLSAVIDWGDMTAGDPCVDFCAVWCALPVQLHDHFRRAYGVVDERIWIRGKGWGLMMALLFVEAGRQGAGDAFERVGQQALARILSA